MDTFKTALSAAGFKGEIDDSPASRDFYSHDASLFELRPELIVSPKDSTDVQNLVKAVNAGRKTNSKLSITARSAGTDMSGGAINDSIIADFNKHFTTISNVSPTEARTQPGVF